MALGEEPDPPAPRRQWITFDQVTKRPIETLDKDCPDEPSVSSRSPMRRAASSATHRGGRPALAVSDGCHPLPLHEVARPPAPRCRSATVGFGSREFIADSTLVTHSDEPSMPLPVTAASSVPGSLPQRSPEASNRQELEATEVTPHPCARVALPPTPRCRVGAPNRGSRRDPRTNQRRSPSRSNDETRFSTPLPNDRRLLIGLATRSRNHEALQRERETEVPRCCCASNLRELGTRGFRGRRWSADRSPTMVAATTLTGMCVVSVTWVGSKTFPGRESHERRASTITRESLERPARCRHRGTLPSG